MSLLFLFRSNRPALGATLWRGAQIVTAFHAASLSLPLFSLEPATSPGKLEYEREQGEPGAHLHEQHMQAAVP